MTACRPEVLRGTQRRRDATVRSGESRPRQAKKAVDGSFESRAVWAKTNRATPPAGVAGSAGSDSSQRTGFAGAG
jgi:hypothetical protein